MGGGAEAEGDFAAFVSVHQGQFLRMAVALTGSSAAALDLVQIALMRTYAKWARVGGQDPVAYTRRIIINANHDRWRRQFREHALSPEQGVHGDHAVSLTDRNAIVSALSELTDRERTVVVLRFLGDLSEAETAAELSLKVGTVKSTTHRALRKLRVSSHLIEQVQEI